MTIHLAEGPKELFFKPPPPHLQTSLCILIVSANSYFSDGPRKFEILIFSHFQHANNFFLDVWVSLDSDFLLNNLFLVGKSFFPDFLLLFLLLFLIFWLALFLILSASKNNCHLKKTFCHRPHAVGYGAKTTHVAE